LFIELDYSPFVKYQFFGLQESKGNLLNHGMLRFKCTALFFFISFPSASGRTRDEKKRSKPARRCKDQARQAGKNQEENKLLTRSWHF
jgi:hypothetical protein